MSMTCMNIIITIIIIIHIIITITIIIKWVITLKCPMQTRITTRLLIRRSWIPIIIKRIIRTGTHCIHQFALLPTFRISKKTRIKSSRLLSLLNHSISRLFSACFFLLIFILKSFTFKRINFSRTFFFSLGMFNFNGILDSSNIC